jgi:hypothetical protein
VATADLDGAACSGVFGQTAVQGRAAHPVRRISSLTSVPSSGAMHSANHSASSALDGTPSLSSDGPVSGERISPAGSSAVLWRGSLAAGTARRDCWSRPGRLFA